MTKQQNPSPDCHYYFVLDPYNLIAVLGGGRRKLALSKVFYV